VRVGGIVAVTVAAAVVLSCGGISSAAGVQAAVRARQSDAS
jgi:hypothetical protein